MVPDSDLNNHLQAEEMGGGRIYKKILATLEHNGDIDDQEFRRMVFFALVDLGGAKEQIAEVNKKLDELERNSVLLIARKHPKISFVVAVFVIVFVVSVIARLELWPWFFELIGVPLL